MSPCRQAAAISRAISRAYPPITVIISLILNHQTQRRSWSVKATARVGRDTCAITGSFLSRTGAVHQASLWLAKGWTLTPITSRGPAETYVA